MSLILKYGSVIAMVFFAIGFEIRILYHSFSQFMVLSQGWNALVLTVALLFALSFPIAYLLDNQNKKVDTFVRICMTISGLLFSIVFGINYIYIPVICLSIYLGFYFLKQKPFYVFIIYYLVLCCSYNWNNMWISMVYPKSILPFRISFFIIYLIFNLFIFEFGGLSLKLTTLAYCIMFISVFIMLFPPLYSQENTRFFSLIILSIYTIIFCILEIVLYNETVIKNGEYTRIYSSYFLFITCAIGIYLSKRIFNEKGVLSVFPWLISSIHLSKLFILIGFSISDIKWLIILFAVICFPIFNKIPPKKPEYVFVSIIITGIVLFFLRYPILKNIYDVIFQNQVNSAVVNSCTLIIWGIISLLYDKFSTELTTYNHRFILVIFVIAALLYFLQPELELSLLLTDLYNSIILRSTPFEAAKQYFFIYYNRPLWPPWVLMILLIITLLVIVDVISIKKSLFMRVTYSIILGLGIGLYVTGSFYPMRISLFISICIMFIITSFIFIFLLYPVPAISKVLLWLYI